MTRRTTARIGYPLVIVGFIMMGLYDVTERESLLLFIGDMLIAGVLSYKFYTTVRKNDARDA